MYERKIVLLFLITFAFHKSELYHYFIHINYFLHLIKNYKALSFERVIIFLKKFISGSEVMGLIRIIKSDRTLTMKTKTRLIIGKKSDDRGFTASPDIIAIKGKRLRTWHSKVGIKRNDGGGDRKWQRNGCTKLHTRAGPTALLGATTLLLSAF